jgi:hypothetical protein
MTEDLPPILREFEVGCSLEHAFHTWTHRCDLWWPLKRHSISLANAASVTIEPQLGGLIFETTRGGERILWGAVNIWEPPDRFGYLWHLGEADASEATQGHHHVYGAQPHPNACHDRAQGMGERGPEGRVQTPRERVGMGRPDSSLHGFHFRRDAPENAALMNPLSRSTPLVAKDESSRNLVVPTAGASEPT